MEFFDYKTTEVAGLKTGRTRFSAVVFTNPMNAPAGCDVWKQNVTKYADGKEIVEDGGKVTFTIADAGILTDSFPLYHPETGAEVGTMTFGELVGIVYSAAIAIDKKNDAPVEPVAPVTPDVPVDPIVTP